MFASSITLLLLALLFRSVEAGVRFNAPSGDTVWDASKPQYIKWRESGTADNRTTLEELGSLSVTLWAGSSTDGKTQVATLGTVAATAKELQVNLPTNAGASGGVYFIQFASTSMPDNVYDSSKFELTGMTGTFPVAVQQAIGGSSNSSSSTRGSSNSNSSSPIISAPPGSNANANTNSTRSQNAMSDTSGAMTTSALGGAAASLVFMAAWCLSA